MKKPTEINQDWTDLNNLSNKITELMNYSLNQKEEWTTRTQFLFKQKERLQNIRDFATNKPVLEAYLVLQTFKYKEGMSVAKIIDRIGQEVEQSAKKVEKKATKHSELTNEQLLTLLGERITGNEIERKYEYENNPITRTWNKGFPYIGIWDEKTGKRIIAVCLTTGKIDPDPATKFLDKHNFKK